MNPADIELFPAPKLPLETLDQLSEVVEADYEARARTIVMNNKKTGRVELESLSPSRSKGVLDEIDKTIGSAYRFSEVDLDVIINCDIKYRVGPGAAPDDEDAADD